VDKLETAVFDPDLEYVHRTVKAASVNSYLEASKFKLPVFMVTGSKIARGVAFGNSAVRAVSAGLRGSAPVGGSGVSLEGHVESAQERYEGTSFEESTDFVLAFRVRKVRYKKGKVRQEFYTKGASMQDGEDDGGRGSDLEILGLDDETDLSDVLPLSHLSTVEDGGIQWLVRS
jgi:hypothetical protein